MAKHAMEKRIKKSALSKLSRKKKGVRRKKPKMMPKRGY